MQVPHKSKSRLDIEIKPNNSVYELLKKQSNTLQKKQELKFVNFSYTFEGVELSESDDLEIDTKYIKQVIQMNKKEEDISKKDMSKDYKMHIHMRDLIQKSESQLLPNVKITSGRIQKLSPLAQKKKYLSQLSKSPKRTHPKFDPIEKLQ
ncbi:Hypothetical_protein [Hexamita inflata]|uniref:Hypothetical_protein n=1 Tax=Hexamita inflata TaxID=28002 RepID=A0ABP1GLC0_9EUKA